MYLDRNHRDFIGCEGTIFFTKRINNLFDALNRSFPKEGIKMDSSDLKVFLTFFLI